MSNYKLELVDLETEKTVAYSEAESDFIDFYNLATEHGFALFENDKWIDIF